MSVATKPLIANDGPARTYSAQPELLAKIAGGRSVRHSGLNFGLALLAHGLFFAIILVLPKPQAPVEIKSQGNVNVSIIPGTKKNQPAAVPAPPPLERAQSLPQTSKPKSQSKSRPTPKAAVLPPKLAEVPKGDFGVQEGTSNVQVPAENSSAGIESAGVETTAPQPEITENYGPSTVPKGLKRLLPSINNTYLQDQRNMGQTLGEGPVAGDIPDDLPPENVDPEKRAKIVEQEYTYTGYFEMLKSRFSEAWGNTRILPPDATFAGVEGEYIEYDIVINKDGSLRKIVNITAKKQPNRDFKDVDTLVVDVFKVVFPLPVPKRFKKDPLVIRKRIQFMGYTMKQIF